MIMKAPSMMSKKGTEKLFNLTLTGQQPLYFSNTLEQRKNATPPELLNSYDAFLRWGRHTEHLTKRQGQNLLKEAARRPDEARAVVARAIELRETIYRLLSVVA